MGELSLDGFLKPIKGALPIAIQARKENFEGFILPKENAREAAIVNNLKVLGATHISEIIDFFNGDESKLERIEIDTRKEFETNLNNIENDFSDVRGQENIKLVGYSIENFALEMVTRLSSKGCRITSKTLRLNSGNSSKNKTPLWAKEISPGCGLFPPPTKAMSLMV